MIRCIAMSQIFIPFLLFPGLCASGQTTTKHTISPVAKQLYGSAQNDVLILFRDTANGDYGYKNAKGDIIIPPGKYLACFTDTFRAYAIVTSPHKGFVAIDRHENELYGVFAIDNGPDYPSDGLFRIVVDNKIGYADLLTGQIIIKPRFACAWPFEQGVAKVSMDCKKRRDGEHTVWISESWYYIDKSGRKSKRG